MVARVAPRLRVTSCLAMRDAAIAGLGIASLPTFHSHEQHLALDAFSMPLFTCPPSGASAGTGVPLWIGYGRGSETLKSWLDTLGSEQKAAIRLHRDAACDLFPR